MSTRLLVKQQLVLAAKLIKSEPAKQHLRDAIKLLALIEVAPATSTLGAVPKTPAPRPAHDHDTCIVGKCGKCSGTGIYSWGAITNGVPAHSGTCFQCAGDGKVTEKDVARTNTYWQYHTSAA